MLPITDYKEFLNNVKNNQDEEEQWYILIIVNPYNLTPLVTTFLRNYQYLHDRTGSTRYFIPGFANDLQLKDFGRIIDGIFQPYEELLLEDLRIGFNQQGMLDTVKWLEQNCQSYKYNEGIDLILIKSYRHKGNSQLDVENLISIPLEEVYKEGGNVIKTMTHVRFIVNNNPSVGDAKEEINTYMKKAVYSNHTVGQPNTGVYPTPIFKVFCAGSKDLHNERNAVRAQLQQISNLTSIAFSCYTYEDFSREFAEKGQQALYNDFISYQADFAVFIIDGKIGGITFQEFETAMSAFKMHRKPRIFTYYKENNSNTGLNKRAIKDIINEIKKNDQYYCEYRSLSDLEHCIRQDFMTIAWELRN